MPSKCPHLKDDWKASYGRCPAFVGVVASHQKVVDVGAHNANLWWSRSFPGVLWQRRVAEDPEARFGEKTFEAQFSQGSVNVKIPLARGVDQAVACFVKTDSLTDKNVERTCQFRHKSGKNLPLRLRRPSLQEGRLRINLVGLPAPLRKKL